MFEWSINPHCAMAFVKRFQYFGAKTFADITQRYVRRILSLVPSNCTCVNVVGDRYDIGEDKSLKGDERQRKNQSEQSREFHPSNALPVPDIDEKSKKQGKPP